jgi:hypothetical protein
MTTATVVTKPLTLPRAKGFTRAVRAALKVAAAATTANDVSNPLRASLADQAAAVPVTIKYRGFDIRVGINPLSYSVVFPDGSAHSGPLADVMGDINAWFTGKP